MAITIIKRGRKAWKDPVCEVVCENCESELTYNKSDLTTYVDDRPCGVYIEYITCPVCNNRIVTKRL